MIIKIKNLRLKTILGVYDWEQKIEREIIINAAIKTSHLNSLQSDDLSDTIDYDDIIKKIKKLITEKRFKLIEKMTQEVMDTIMQNSRVLECELEIDKVGVVENVDSFSVTLTQKR